MSIMWYFAVIIGIPVVAALLLSIGRRKHGRMVHNTGDSGETLDSLEEEKRVLHGDPAVKASNHDFPYQSPLYNPLGHQSPSVQSDDHGPDPDQDYKGD